MLLVRALKNWPASGGVEKFTLELNQAEVTCLCGLPSYRNKTLEEVSSMLSSLIRKLSEHLNKDALPEEACGLLVYLEGIPEIDCESVPDDARTFVKGWMIQSALVTAMIGHHYDLMGAEA